MSAPFLAELKRRNVLRMAGLYLVGAWLLVQVAETVLPAFDVPAWVLRAVIIVLALGLVPALVFAWVFELTPEGLKRDADVAPGQSIAPQTARRMDRLIVFGLLGVVALVAADRFWPRSEKGRDLRSGNTDSQVTKAPALERGAELVSAPAGAETASAAPNSIAVLPFVDMSQARDQEYFSDGLSEELLNQLAQIPQLRVIARTSSFSFKGKNVDVATIAQALDVAHVLEGSVRKSGDRLRITAQLIRAADSSHLWSQTYDRQPSDVFEVQDEIAGEVVAALKVKLLPTQQLTSRQRTSNAEAYEQYLLGMEAMRDGREAAAGAAVMAFQRAIALDPGYANAHARLSVAQRVFADFVVDPAQRAGVIRQALASSERAIELAPELSDGYEVRGIHRHLTAWEWAGAEADLKKAVALDPNKASTLTAYAHALFFDGRRAEAIAMGRKAVGLDPLSPGAWAGLGRQLAYDGRAADARAALQRSLELEPNGNWPAALLGNLSLSEGDAEGALSWFRRAPEHFRLTGTAMAEHTRGNSQASQHALDVLKQKFAVGFAFQIAQVHAWRGENDQAFEWLNRAYDNHDAGMVRLRAEPMLERLRDDPRFAALVRKLGFTEQGP